MSARKNKSLHRDALPLRIIPINEPGASGFTMQIVNTDDQETAIRNDAASQGLLVGTPMRFKA
jgi:hypothetical protein